MANRNYNNISYTKHANYRREECQITESSIQAAVNHGEKDECSPCKVFYDENVKVVLGYNETVVTASPNHHNTRRDLSEKTKHKEKDLLEKVRRGNTYAMCQLGDFYLDGNLCRPDVKKAFEMFKKAADTGNSHAMCKIADMYNYGLLGKQDEKLRDEWYTKAANARNTFANTFLAKTLLKEYVEKYPPDANIFRPSAPKEEILHYIDESTKRGGTKGIRMLGNIYQFGLLGEKDLPKAIEYYVQAAKTGSPASLQSLYELSKAGDFSIDELEVILDTLTPRLTTTSVGMAIRLGEMQVEGVVGYNRVRGLNMIEQVASKGSYVEAMSFLANFYKTGDQGGFIKSNLHFTQYWYNKLHELHSASAEDGNIKSLWFLGEMYLNGDFGNIDLGKAELYFKEAIDKSQDPEHMYNLGIMYLEGRLGDNPIELGLNLIYKAIKIWKEEIQQNPDLQVNYSNVGRAYLKLYDYKSAHYWFNKSIDSNKVHVIDIYLNELSPLRNSSHGLKLLKEIISEKDTDLTFVDKYFYTSDTVEWLQTIVETEEILSDDCADNELKQNALSFLVNVYSEGRLGKLDYGLCSKYCYMLYKEFNDESKIEMLITFLTEGNLPEEYIDEVKSWVLNFPPTSKLTETDFSWLSSIPLLYQLYKKSNLLSQHNEKLYPWIYVYSKFEGVEKSVKDDLQELLLTLDSSKKEDIASYLVNVTENTKSREDSRIMYRIMGDLFNGDELVGRNIDKAIEYYTQAALRNNSLAAYKLGSIYENDKIDLGRAIKWFKLSVRLGCKDALESLEAIQENIQVKHLESFLTKYEVISTIPDSELAKTKPYKDLEKFPTSSEDKYKLGKSLLNKTSHSDLNALNAAYWLREASNRGNVDASVELYSMYESGLLGKNVVTTCNYKRLDLLCGCYFKLQLQLRPKYRYTSEIIFLLKVITCLIKVDNVVCSELNQLIESVINLTDFDSETLIKIMSKIKEVQEKLCSVFLDRLKQSVDYPFTKRERNEEPACVNYSE